MAARRLFIHMGPTKTGTSAVQHAFRAHDDPAILYPKVGLWADGSHHNLVYNFYQDYSRPEVQHLDASGMFSKVAELARNDERDILISSETLAGRDVPAFVRALLSHLGAADWTPEILFVCREHYERAASMYGQEVKDSAVRERSGPGDYLRRHASSLRSAPLLVPLRASGIPLSVLNYHPAGDFVHRFLRYIGVADPQAIRNERRNVSLSVKGLIATLAANAVATSAEERSRYFDRLRQMRGFFAPAPLIFEREAMTEVEPLFREDRRILQEQFGVTLPEVDPSIRENRFFIGERELSEIADALAGSGRAGDAILEIASGHRSAR